MIMLGIRRALTLLVFLFVVMGLSATVAWAQFPGTDCSTPPTPEYPGSGVVGDIDPPVVQQGAPGSVLHEVGYGGQVWHTYDLGCGPDAALAPDAVSDTWLGNMLFDLAKFVVAATVAVSDAVAEGGLLSDLDDLLVSSTISLYEGVFVPLVGLALLILAVRLLMLVVRGDLASLSRRVGLAVTGLALASATYLTPLLYITTVDGVLSTTMSQLRNGLLAEVGVDAQHGLSQTLHEQVVYSGWLAGEFGSASSGDAQRFGRDLVRAQAFTRDEVAAGATGDAAVEAKQQRFEAVAESVSPATYEYLTGQAVHRTGTGLYALVKALIYSAFQLAAAVVVFVCLLLLRVVVLLGPVLGLIAILRQQALSELVRAVGTAIWQALYLTIVAAVHLAAVVYIAGLDLPGVGSLLLLAALTTVLWWAVRPWQRLRSMVAASAAVAGAEVSAGKPRRRIDFDLDTLRAGGRAVMDRVGPPQPPDPDEWRPRRPEAAPDGPSSPDRAANAHVDPYPDVPPDREPARAASPAPAGSATPDRAESSSVVDLDRYRSRAASHGAATDSTTTERGDRDV